VVRQVVAERAVGEAETGDDIAHGLQRGTTLFFASVLHAQIAHDYLLQPFIGAGYPHRERWLIFVRHASG
jgi:hypothetical protein